MGGVKTTNGAVAALAVLLAATLGGGIAVAVTGAASSSSRASGPVPAPAAPAVAASPTPSATPPTARDLSGLFLAPGSIWTQEADVPDKTGMLTPADTGVTDVAAYGRSWKDANGRVLKVVLLQVATDTDASDAIQTFLLDVPGATNMRIVAGTGQAVTGVMADQHYGASSVLHNDVVALILLTSTKAVPDSEVDTLSSGEATTLAAAG